MSAALKRAPEPTPFASPERAALAHAIARAAGADIRKAALVKACATADEEVRLARRAVDAAGEAVEAAPSNTARHLTDTALGTAGEPPLTIRQARAVAIAAADDLEAAIAARDALLKAERVDGNGLSALLVTDAARAVIRAEVGERGVAMAARVAELQRQLVELGSGLEWLHRAGAFPRTERGKDDPIPSVVGRMDVAPQQWAMGAIRYPTSFAQPTGANAWAAAFEALKLDADAPLPVD